MKKTLPKVLAVIGASLALLLAWGISSIGAAPDMCANEELTVALSPDKKMKAIVFQRDCGATSGFSTQVSLLPASETLKNEGGNVFSADTDHGRAPSGVGGGPELKISWRGNSELHIEHHRNARIFANESAFGNIQISYGKFE